MKLTKERRIKVLRIPAAWLAPVLLGDARVIDGIPRDVVYLGASYDFQGDSFLVAFGHPTFEPVELGRMAPEINAVINYNAVSQ